MPDFNGETKSRMDEMLKAKNLEAVIAVAKRKLEDFLEDGQASEEHWKNKYLKLKGKYQALQKEISQVRSANLDLQQALLAKIFDAQNPQYPLVQMEESDGEVTNQLVLPETSPPVPCESPDDDPDPDWVYPDPANTSSNSEDCVLPHSPVTFRSGEEYLNREQKILCLRGVHSSARGDSVYAKNLALAVFGREVLMTSSINGTPCPSQKGAACKPPLCPLKLEYIRNVFKERIYAEGVPPLEAKKRVNKFNRYVSEKMMGLVRFNKKKLNFDQILGETSQ